MNDWLMKLIRSKKSLFLIFCALVALLYFILPLEPRIQLPPVEGNPMSLVYVFAASQSEGAPLASLLKPSEGIPSAWRSGRVGVNDVALFITGIGPKPASLKAASALQSFGANASAGRRPDAVIVAGSCGSLSRTSNEGDVILYSACLSTSKRDRLECPAAIAKHFKNRLNARGFLCRSTLGISSPRVAVSKAEKLELAKSGAEVVDMESYEIVAAANQAGIPVVVIRVVSDSLDRKIADLNLAIRETGEIDPLGLLKLGIGSPILTAKTLAASHRAATKLKSVIAVVLSDEIFSKIPVEVAARPPG